MGRQNLKVELINHKGRVEKSAKRSRWIWEGESFVRWRVNNKHLDFSSQKKNNLFLIC